MKSQTPVEFGSSSDLSASVERRTIVGSFVAGLSIAIVALFLSDVALGEETDGVLKCLKSISSLGTETVSNGDYRGPDNLFITRLSGGDYVVVEKNQKFFRCKNESAPKGRGEAYKLIVSPDLVLFTHRASKVQAPASQLDIDVSGAPIEVRYYVGRTKVYGDYYGQGRPVYGKMTLSHHPIECQMWESKPALEALKKAALKKFGDSILDVSMKVEAIQASGYDPDPEYKTEIRDLFKPCTSVDSVAVNATLRNLGIDPIIRQPISSGEAAVDGKDPLAGAR